MDSNQKITGNRIANPFGLKNQGGQPVNTRPTETKTQTQPTPITNPSQPSPSQKLQNQNINQQREYDILKIFNSSKNYLRLTTERYKQIRLIK